MTYEGRYCFYFSKWNYYNTERLEFNLMALKTLWFSVWKQFPPPPVLLPPSPFSYCAVGLATYPMSRQEKRKGSAQQWKDMTVSANKGPLHNLHSSCRSHGSSARPAALYCKIWNNTTGDVLPLGKANHQLVPMYKIN